MMKPRIIKGNYHKDQRGTICYNNDFDASQIKRVYTIENAECNIVRAWQGHKIEQRWFSAVLGSFMIKLIEIDNWENSSRNIKVFEFVLKTDKLDILHVPAGFVSSIKALEKHSKLLVMADYHLNEIQDEYRFPSEYFD